MVLTIDFIARSFSKFNDEYFDGRLKTPVFEIMHTKRLLGQCKWDNRGSKRMNYRIRISDYYQRDEKQYQNTILHEMIHLFMRQNDIKDTRTHHGQVFYRYADFINEYGWNIARTDDIRGLDINTSEVITYYLAAFRDKNGKYFLMRYNPKYKSVFIKRFTRYNDYYMDVVWFTSEDNAKYAMFSECRKSVRGFYISKQEYYTLKEKYAVREAV